MFFSTYNVNMYLICVCTSVKKRLCQNHKTDILITLKVKVKCSLYRPGCGPEDG